MSLAQKHEVIPETITVESVFEKLGPFLRITLKALSAHCFGVIGKKV